MAYLKGRIPTILCFNLGIIVILIMGSCSSKPPMLSEPVINNWVIDAPLETLWKSTIAALVDKGVQIDILDKETGLIVGVEDFTRGSINQYIAEPYSYYGGQARINILFSKENEDKTRVTIKPTIFGFGRSYYPLKLTSNGRLERDYYLLISGSIPKERTYKWLEDEKSLKEGK